MAKIMKIGWQ